MIREGGQVCGAAQDPPRSPRAACEDAHLPAVRGRMLHAGGLHPRPWGSVGSTVSPQGGRATTLSQWSLEISRADKQLYQRGLGMSEAGFLPG